eukprot:GILK01010133.1.p1 GENE.GILK01010133.1~~GILK01010133.1.p1  ORF type:complete len:715 (-),score=47.94 GILK01010133.1:101-2245(-)
MGVETGKMCKKRVFFRGQMWPSYVVLFSLCVFSSQARDLTCNSADVDSAYCSGHGKCVFIASENQTVCICRNAFVGAYCEDCKAGYFGSTCESCPSSTFGEDENHIESVCGKHGLCNDGRLGNGMCICDEGFEASTNCTLEIDYVAEERAITLGITYLLLSAVATILMVFAFLKFPKLHYLPDSVAAIILGIIIGCFLLITRDTDSSVSGIVFFDARAFFLLLLPPIMFDAGFSLKKSSFFSNIGSIFVFAVLGTIVSALVFALLLWFLGLISVSYDLSIIDSLMFGSLIAAVDPVATLAIFQALDVDPKLHMLVFGESTLNDAVAIALFNTFTAFAPQTASTMSWFGPFRLFFTLFFGSILIGVACGIMSAVLFKHIPLREFPSLEYAMLLLFSYLPFVLCEGLGLSGILGILFAGMIMGHYTFFSLSHTTQVSAQQTCRTAAFVAETFVFVYLGISLPLLPHVFSWSLIFWGIVLLFVSRAANIFPLAKLCNRFRSTKISKADQIIMWFSGLRGAIAFALSLNFPGENKQVIITTTLILVLFTVLVLGGGTLPLLKYLKHMKPQQQVSHVDSVVISHARSEDVEPVSAMFERAGATLNRFERFDKDYLQRWFRYERAPHTFDMFSPVNAMSSQSSVNGDVELSNNLEYSPMGPATQLPAFSSPSIQMIPVPSRERKPQSSDKEPLINSVDKISDSSGILSPPHRSNDDRNQN